MNVDPVRTYMSHALLVAYAVRHGRSYEHLLEPLAAAEKQLGGARKTIVDRRLNRAVAELLDGADPPRPARMNVEGMTAVDADLYAEELLAIYRDRLRDLGRPSWKDPIRKDASQKIAQLEERQRAKAAAKAVEKSNTAAAPAAVVEKAANADARLRELVRSEVALQMAKSFTIDFDGERTWTINGQSFRVPTHIDRGAWSARGSYEKGDGVSYGGSWWICKDAATTDRPGSSSAWRLAVKKGRDGKDAA